MQLDNIIANKLKGALFLRSSVESKVLFLCVRMYCGLYFVSPSVVIRECIFDNDIGRDAGQ